jgi:hypothetical protein
MARKTEILLIDDVDGASADETVTFGLDGVSYEIDLTSARATELRQALSTYTRHGRKVPGRGPAQRVRSTGRYAREAGRDYVPAEVRAWAVSQGMEVPMRGRIPGDILDKYRAAH